MSLPRSGLGHLTWFFSIREKEVTKTVLDWLKNTPSLGGKRTSLKVEGLTFSSPY